MQAVINEEVETMLKCGVIESSSSPWSSSYRHDKEMAFKDLKDQRQYYLALPFWKPLWFK